MNKISILALTTVAALLAGCGPNSYLNDQNVGAVLGGVGGGVVGNQIGSGTTRTVATIAGTLVGAGIGGAIGHSMDQVDRAKMAQGLSTTPNNQTTQWQSNGTNYAVTPTNTYQNQNGQTCRNFNTTANINGQMQQITGTACRLPNGSWQIVR